MNINADYQGFFFHRGLVMDWCSDLESSILDLGQPSIFYDHFWEPTVELRKDN
jgi:hypothetical protein